MSVGIASDLFAVIYIAKEHKLYVLNSSGMAPTGATSNASTNSATTGTQRTGADFGMPPYGFWW